MTYDQIGATAPLTGHHTALGLIEEEDLDGTPAAEYLKKRKSLMRIFNNWNSYYTHY